MQGGPRISLIHLCISLRWLSVTHRRNLQKTKRWIYMCQHTKKRSDGFSCLCSSKFGLQTCFFFDWSCLKVPSTCLQAAKALAGLRLCAGSPEHLLVAYVISTLFSCADLYGVTPVKALFLTINCLYFSYFLPKIYVVVFIKNVPARRFLWVPRR